MEKSVNLLKEKYQDNIYSKKQFFEVLKMIEELHINLIKFQQKNHQKQWKLALKNPLSSIEYKNKSN